MLLPMKLVTVLLLIATVAAGNEPAASSSCALASVLPGLRQISFDLPCPAYYNNLDQTVGRRSIIEDTFGRLWGENLHRIPGVHGPNQSQVFAMTGDGPIAQRAWEPHAFHRGRRGLSELGCILSHLRAIRTAYLAGDEVGLVLEDDVAPSFMPYWSIGLGDVLDLLTGTPWDTVQLSYTSVEHPEARCPFPGVPQHDVLLGGHLWKLPYQWGTAGYLISRHGMEKVMNKYFESLTAESLAIPAIEGNLAMDADAYYHSLMTENYIVFPAMFATLGTGSMCGEYGDSLIQVSNDNQWRHWQDDLRRRYSQDLRSAPPTPPPPAGRRTIVRLIN